MGKRFVIGQFVWVYRNARFLPSVVVGVTAKGVRVAAHERWAAAMASGKGVAALGDALVWKVHPEEVFLRGAAAEFDSTVNELNRDRDHADEANAAVRIRMEEFVKRHRDRVQAIVAAVAGTPS